MKKAFSLLFYLLWEGHILQHPARNHFNISQSFLGKVHISKFNEAPHQKVNIHIYKHMHLQTCTHKISVFLGPQFIHGSLEGLLTSHPDYEALIQTKQFRFNNLIYSFVLNKTDKLCLRILACILHNSDSGLRLFMKNCHKLKYVIDFLPSRCISF